MHLTSASLTYVRQQDLVELRVEQAPPCRETVLRSAGHLTGQNHSTQISEIMYQ